MIETRTHAQPLYPGSFFPEVGDSQQVDRALTPQEIAARIPDDSWFAVEVTTRPWQRWTTPEGDVQWRPVSSDPGTMFRIYVGEVFTADEIRALGDEPGHHILLANMLGNNWPRMVRTRRGNWQPLGDHDVILTDAPHK